LGGVVEVHFEAGNDIGPPEFLFGLAQFEFHLLVGIEESVEQFVGGDAGEGAAGVLLLADEAEGFVVVGGGADEEGEDLVLLIGGEGELFGEFGEAFAGRSFGLAGLGEVFGGGGREGFDAMEMGGMRGGVAGGDLLVEALFGGGGGAAEGGGFAVGL